MSRALCCAGKDSESELSNSFAIVKKNSLPFSLSWRKSIKIIFVVLGAGFPLVLPFYLNAGKLQKSQLTVLSLHFVGKSLINISDRFFFFSPLKMVL